MKEWIILSSVLLLALILLRFFFRRQISARLQYALWGLALLRLLIPFSIRSTPISVMNFVQPVPTVSEQVTTVTKVPQTTPAAGTPIIYPAADESDSAPAVQQPQAIADNSAPQIRSIGLSAILPWMWGLGSLCTALLLFGSNLHFYLRLRRSRQALPDVSTKLPVYCSTQLASPCLFGRSIYITPSALETPERLQHVLTHELCHWEQGDPLWALLRSLCLALWWWNPLVWIAAFLSRSDCEAACDERAIRKLGEAQRLDYGKTLVDMIAAASVPHALLCTATTMTSRHMRERLLRIVQHKKVRNSITALALILALVCTGCTFTGAKEPVSETSYHTATLEFQLLEDGLLVCLEGEGDAAEMVRVRPNGLLSEATLRALRTGDVLTVRYTNRTAREIDAADISIDPVSGGDSNVDPVAPVVPSEVPEPSGESDSPSSEPDPPKEDTLISPDDPKEVRASLESFFNDPNEGINRRQVLTTFYDNASQVDLASLFYNGAVSSNTLNFEDLSRPEQEALKKLASHSEYREWADVERITSNEMDIALQKHFGITLAGTEMTGLSRFEYLPEFDSYYFFHTDTNALLPIRILDVLIDSESYYYMTYQFTETDGKESHLCCLYRSEGSWKVVYNREESGEAPSGAAAVSALSEQQAQSYTVLRPGISASLDYAISSALLDYARAQMPGYADFVTEAHEVLHLEWHDELLSVDAVSLCKIFNEEEGQVVELERKLRLDCLTLAFRVSPSGDQLCYQLEELSLYEDPSDPDGVFGNREWSIAAGLRAADILPSLEAQCDAQSTSMPTLDPDYSEAFLAAMSGYDAAEAAQNVADYCGKQRHILRYQPLGAEERQRATNVLVEELKGSELAASMGWDDDYIERYVRVVQVGYSVEYNPHFGTDLESGVYQQEFYVCRDPETRLWRVYSMGERIKLIDYLPNS